jgi:hypothetical protein
MATWRAAHLRALLIVACGFACAPPKTSADDSLGMLRDEARTPSSDEAPDEEPAPEKKRKKKRRHDDDCDDGFHSVLGEAVVVALVFTVAAPFWAPHSVLDEGFSVSGYFPRYPYADGAPGHMLLWPELDYEHYTWSTRLSAEYADLGRQERVGGYALWEHTSRFGIEASAHHWTEQLGAGADDLWTGDVNAIFRFAQNEHVQMRTGLGVNWLADDAGSDLGFNFTYGGDVFPIRPLIFSADLDWGRLGHAGLFHFRATAGAALRSVEIYTGYDYFDVGQAQFDGWIAGVRFWL